MILVQNSARCKNARSNRTIGTWSIIVRWKQDRVYCNWRKKWRDWVSKKMRTSLKKCSACVNICYPPFLKRCSIYLYVKCTLLNSLFIYGYFLTNSESSCRVCPLQIRSLTTEICFLFCNLAKAKWHATCHFYSSIMNPLLTSSS